VTLHGRARVSSRSAYSLLVAEELHRSFRCRAKPPGPEDGVRRAVEDPSRELGERALGPPAGHVHLEEAVARVDVALCADRVFERLRDDVGNAESIGVDGRRRREAGDLERLGLRRHRAREQGCRDESDRTGAPEHGFLQGTSTSPMHV
jgi:hypothetical protein